MVENDDKEDAKEKKEDNQASQKERRTKLIYVVLKSMALLILVSKIIYQTDEWSLVILIIFSALVCVDIMSSHIWIRGGLFKFS